jgi:hypothetical protein
MAYDFLRGDRDQPFLLPAAELTCEANDVHQLQPMLQATAATLASAGIDQRPEAALADSGYWSIGNLTAIPTRRSSSSRRPGTAARASPARTASRPSPRATACAPP